MIVFDIIVPVYNTEQYLPGCLHSIANQSYRFFNCVLVNDGSTDGSGDICDEWATKDNRFSVIHKINSGPGASRNIGMAKAEGDYLLFIDSDDFWIDSYCLEKINAALLEGEPDVLVFGIYDFIEKVNKLRNRTIASPSDKNDACYLLENSRFKSTMTDKAICRELAVKHNMRFSESIRMGEDQHFVADMLRYSLKIKYLPIPMYVYRKHSASATKSFRKRINKTCEDLYCVFSEGLEIGNSIDCANAKNMYFSFFADSFLSSLGIYSPVYKNYKKRLIPLFRFWDFRITRNVELAYHFRNIFGTKITVLFLSLWLKVKEKRSV
jgi:glycosyltransferase involved in cell wall biosynthesis